MKLKIFLCRDTLPKLRLDADMKKADLDGQPWTANTIYLDLSKTPHGVEYDLKKWKIRRGRDRFTGFNNEVSPELKDGDQVTFYAAKKNS